MNRNNATIRLTVAVAAVAALAGLTACSTKPISKAGSTDQHPQAIVLQMPDGSDPDGLYLAQDIAKLSHGALKVTIDSKTYDSTLPANEARLTADIRAGRVSFAYQPARDWAAVGVPGFQALMAPFAVTTVAASQRVAASPVAATVLGQLPKYGAVGVGLIAGEPRQILSVRPLFAPGRNSPGRRSASSTTRRPRRWSPRWVPVRSRALASNKVNSPLRAGLVTAVETSPFYIAENAYQNAAPYLTSYAVFPKFETLVASKKAWAALSPSESGGDQAGRRRYPAAFWSAGGPRGPGAHPALPAGRRARPAHGRPARRAGPATLRQPRPSAAAAAVERQIRALPGTGVQPNATGIPAGCRVAGDAATATAIHRVLTPALAHQGGGKIPPGTYVVTDTVADFRGGRPVRR